MERECSRGIHYAILGPFEVEVAGRRVSLGGARQRSVLAFLLLNARQLVSVDRLVDAVWEGCPPRAAEQCVRVYISRLRKILAHPSPGAASPLMSKASGYLLHADPQDIDAERFELLVAEGRRADDGGHDEVVGRLLRSALALWRGPALAGFPQRWASAHATRLDELRQAAVENRIKADLALGAHGQLVSELAAAVNEYPLRERLHEQRMLALYRCGRQADALDAYRDAYRLLADERGIVPGSKLRELEAAILRQDPQLDWAPPAPSTQVTNDAATMVPAQLPADVTHFTGRTAEVRELNRGHSPTTPITVIVGAAGVGKTALAVHQAHRIAPDFPAGQLYIDLRGYDPGQEVRPVEALASFLRALGVDPKRVPPTEQDAAGLYRSLLAGRRVLVVLDNAGSAEQVRPLIPGTDSCTVLVTSRERLTGLVARDGARRLTLGVLHSAEAVTLLERIVGTDRVRAEPAAAAELADDCGYLPLALRITAANLLNHRHCSITDHVEDLRAGDRLAALQVEGDESTGVRAAFNQSYTALRPDARRVFRLVGLVPGVDFTPEAVAALAGATAAAAQAVLERLASAHLVDQHTRGRYTMHDLLRRFARERAEAEDEAAERTAAAGRLYDWYLRRVRAGAQALYPEMLLLPPTGEEAADHAAMPFADRLAALRWLDGERSNLVSAVSETARSGPKSVAWLLSDALRGYFWIRRYTVDWLAVAQAGHAAARGAGQEQAAAAAQISLAMAHRCLNNYVAAAGHYARARELSKRAGWPLGQAAAMNNVSCVYVRLGQLRRAEQSLRGALELNRQSRHGRGVAASNVGNLGDVYLRLGRLREAEAHFVDSLAVRRALDDRYGQADVLQGLGECDHHLGRYDQALEHLAEASALFQEIGSLDGESLVRCVSAAIHRDAGRYRKATDEAGTALALADRTCDQYSEALARNQLGAVQLADGHPREAVEQHSQALRLARLTECPYPEAEALIGLSDAFRRQCAYDVACRLAHEAVAITRRTGLRLLQGHALTALADGHLGSGEYDQAAEYARWALRLHQSTGSPLAQARTLAVLGQASSGRAAYAYFREALVITGGISVPESNRIRAMLASVTPLEAVPGH